MALSTELLSKLEAWSRKRLLKTSSAIASAVLTALLLYLGKDTPSRLTLLGIEAFVMSWLWLSLRVSLLQQRVEKLEAAPAITTTDHLETVLTECELAVLCFLFQSSDELAPMDAANRLSIRYDDAMDAFEKLSRLDFIVPETEATDVGERPTGFYKTSRKGRQHVRKVRPELPEPSPPWD